MPGRRTRRTAELFLSLGLRPPHGSVPVRRGGALEERQKQAGEDVAGEVVDVQPSRRCVRRLPCSAALAREKSGVTSSGSRTRLILHLTQTPPGHCVARAVTASSASNAC
jgi:hypothetical protein